MGLTLWLNTNICKLQTKKFYNISARLDTLARVEHSSLFDFDEEEKKWLIPLPGVNVIKLFSFVTVDEAK